MTRYTVRTLTTDDFPVLTALERDGFGAAGEAVLCPHYLRVCTDIFADTCFLACDEGRPVGYLLCFVRGREAWCTTLAIREEYQRKRVTSMLIGAFVRTVVDQVDVCWFTVKDDNAAARALHHMLGAVEVDRRMDFYGPGDQRIVAKIDRDILARMRPKYQRLGLLDRPPSLDAEAA